MESLSTFMAADHRACDELLAAFEQAVGGRRFDAAQPALRRFVAAMLRHFGREEALLFPAFEAATGARGGPTEVMRMEHDQMRGLFERLEAAVAAGDARSCLALSDSLMVLIQQHNMKEEQILYPMSEDAIPDAGSLLARVVAYELDEA
ncbi:MAG: hemerythrin domain-containing protein [Planctomycetes bacterium]|nr:hemerythrin domain-containing protein [Planctomycetota bacterium]